MEEKQSLRKNFKMTKYCVAKFGDIFHGASRCHEKLNLPGANKLKHLRYSDPSDDDNVKLLDYSVQMSFLI